ncbi:hypothetical protein [Nonlabens sp.]|uniref:hypothetical protein n=1 Tax=Nonlabens sp. TaxID=1888209 RepID=UPI0025FB30C5|nr:hypothetical protein [Nonlabens sp.]
MIVDKKQAHQLKRVFYLLPSFCRLYNKCLFLPVLALIASDIPILFLGIVVLEKKAFSAKENRKQFRKQPAYQAVA